MVQETFAEYLDRILPMIGDEVRVLYFEWDVTCNTDGTNVPNGKLFPYNTLDPELGEWETCIETHGFYPEHDDDWDPLSFVLHERSDTPEAKMTAAIEATIDESAALHRWVDGGHRFLWAGHDTPPREWTSKS